ncbi:MAG: flagellar hook basal-body protein [Ruminococcaceae bacterium]|nr:flagellar hook basal-body protein [Oscillospiraceae bacterium]
MRTAFYAGASGLLANQKAMDNLANNVANVSTTGYKPQNVSFQSLIYDEMYVNTPTDPEKGNGVKVEINDTNFTQSSLIPTNYALDFAITSNALFAVEQDGVVAYTRAGNFNIGMDGETGYLVTQSGGFVLDNNGQRIVLTKKDGTNNFDTTNLINTIGLFTFANANYLTPAQDNLYVVSDKSGAAVAVESNEGQIIQGALEQSGTVLSEEMVEMITLQRAYQLSARVVSVAEENQQTINGLRR